MLGYNKVQLIAGLSIITSFACLIFIEYLLARRKKLQIHLKPDNLANFWVLVIRFSLNALGAAGVLLVIINFVAQYSLHLLDHLPSFVYWPLLILCQDFCYYWFHRYSHVCRWGWASHVVHHSSNCLNYVTAIRESATYLISASWIFWLPLIIIGFTPTSVLTAVAINLIYQFILHSQLTPKLGVFEYILNTPSHHRVHHGRNEQYLDKNFAGIFIIWDRIFGTSEEEIEQPEYGLVHQIYNYNPFYILFHGWYEMFSDVIKYKNLKYLIVFRKE